MKSKRNLLLEMFERSALQTTFLLMAFGRSQAVNNGGLSRLVVQINRPLNIPNIIGLNKIQVNTLFLLSFVAFPLTAFADEKDPLHAIAGVSWEHDNNLFLLPSSKRSDNITKSYAGIQLDKLYSLQRFKVNYTLNSYRYQKNKSLNFSAHNYDAAWLWSLTPRLTGTLYADRTQSLTDFQDFRNFTIRTVKNIRVTQTQRFEADFSPHGVWHLLGGITRKEQKNSETFIEQDNFSSVSLDGGVKYDFRSGSSITMMGHQRNGEYGRKTPNFLSLSDTGYNEKEAEAKLNWLLSGQSRLNLRAAYLTRDHDNFSQRDYSGMEGRADYYWIPTGKLQFGFSANSILSSYWNSDSSYTRENTLSFSPIYNLSNKIRLSANASIYERTFLGGGFVPSTHRVDRGKSVSAGIDWSPWRNFTLGTNLRYSSRDSNISGLDYTDTTAGVDASILF